MRNVLLGYFFTRALVGDRTARTGPLIVILVAGLFLLSLSGSIFDLFAKSFFKGVQDGLRKWEPLREVKHESEWVRWPPLPIHDSPQSIPGRAAAWLWY